MMNGISIARISTIFFLTGIALLCTNCDFPTDPPLRGPEVEPPAVLPTDSTDVLLPLHKDVRWVYMFEAPPRTVSPPRSIKPRLLEIDRLEFFYVPYIAFPQLPSLTQTAFPLLLRNDNAGLSFYAPVHIEDTSRLSVRPSYMFTLPYPARSGDMHEMRRNPEYSVRVTHRDTLVTMRNHPVSLPCHRYEVWHKRKLDTVFYIVPGLCILRIERAEGLIFHTIGWSI
jgi:hypothetical protein